MGTEVESSDPTDTSQPSFKSSKFNVNNSLFTTIMFLIKSNLGTGVLGMAIAVDACGWVIGMFATVFFAVFSGITFIMVGDFIIDFRRFLGKYSPRCNHTVAHIVRKLKSYLETLCNLACIFQNKMFDLNS